MARKRTGNYSLKEYLDKNHISYKGFSEDLGMSYIGFLKVLHGKSDTSLSNAMRIKQMTDGEVIPEHLYKTWLAKKNDSHKNADQKQDEETR